MFKAVNNYELRYFLQFFIFLDTKTKFEEI